MIHLDLVATRVGRQERVAEKAGWHPAGALAVFALATAGMLLPPMVAVLVLMDLVR